MKRLWFLMVLIFPVLLIHGCINIDEDKPFFQPVEIGLPAPDFLFEDINDVHFQLSKARGKVVMLYFWRLRCVACTEALDSVEDLQKIYEDKGLKVVTIIADSLYTAGIFKIKRFLKARGFTFTVLRDMDGYVARAYDVIHIPTVFIIDKQGVLRAIKEDVPDWTSQENIELIEGLLKE